MIERFEAVAKAIADGNRIRILKLLEAGEVCVCQITAVLELAPGTVSKHLSVLKAAGLVRQRRDGKWVHYRLAEADSDSEVGRFLYLVRASLAGDARASMDARTLAGIGTLALCDTDGKAGSKAP